MKNFEYVFSFIVHYHPQIAITNLLLKIIAEMHDIVVIKYSEIKNY